VGNGGPGTLKIRRTGPGSGRMVGTPTWGGGFGVASPAAIEIWIRCRAARV
jgi:hypothetical protein